MRENKTYFFKFKMYKFRGQFARTQKAYYKECKPLLPKITRI